jgi:hypothetical protein
MAILTILLTRPDEPPSKDDRITISSTNLHASLFEVTYKDGHLSHANRVKFYGTCDDVIDYVSTVFQSLEYDVDPFDHIQLCFPAYPAVMYNVTEINYPQVHRVIHAMLRHSLTMYPIQATRVVYPPRHVSTSEPSESSDEGGDESDDESSEGSEEEIPSHDAPLQDVRQL